MIASLKKPKPEKPHGITMTRNREIEKAVIAQLRYDPESGRLWHKDDARLSDGRLKPCHGKTICTINGLGYIQVGITVGQKTIRVLGHRAAWILAHGESPSGMIDHINGSRADNRIKNLRDADSSTNNANRRAKVGRSQDLPVGVSRRNVNGRTLYRVCCWKGINRKTSTKKDLFSAVKLRIKYEEEIIKPQGVSSTQQWIMDRGPETGVHNVGIAPGRMAAEVGMPLGG